MSTTERGLGHAWQQLCEQAKVTYPWICWRCHQLIPRDAPPRSRWSWSGDHLLPRSVYGTQLPPIEDMRPAHLRCNIRRGNRDPEAPPRSRVW